MNSERLSGIDDLGLRPCAEALPVDSYRIEAPEGIVHINVSLDDKGQPFETFIIIGKGGSSEMAFAEALGRLISGHLRRSNPDEIASVLQFLVDQLEGIGGTDSIGFGSNRVRSVPDAVAGILRTYLESDEELNGNAGDVFDRVCNIELDGNNIPIGISLGEGGDISSVGIVDVEDQILDPQIIAITGGVCEFANSLLDIQQIRQRGEIADIADLILDIFTSDDPKHSTTQAISAEMAKMLLTHSETQVSTE